MTASSSSSPRTLAPWLSVRSGDGHKAVSFYRAAFGAEELLHLEGADGSLVSRLKLEQAEFWVSDESPQHGNFSPATLGAGTVRMIFSTPDPDADFARAVAAGATEIHPVADMHGWRVGRVADPFGHHWEIARELAT